MKLTDDGATQSNIAAKVNVTGDSEMVELDDLGDLLETLLELLNLNWIITKTDPAFSPLEDNCLDL